MAKDNIPAIQTPLPILVINLNLLKRTKKDVLAICTPIRQVINSSLSDVRDGFRGSRPFSIGDASPGKATQNDPTKTPINP